MSFVFEIEDALEVGPDPTGFYHGHWTVIFGVLCEGSMHRGEFILVPSRDGVYQVATVSDFRKIPKPGVSNRVNSSSITATEEPVRLELQLLYPVPRGADILPGQATDCSRERYDEIRCSMKSRYPERQQFRSPSVQKQSELKPPRPWWAFWKQVVSILEAIGRWGIFPF